MLSLTALLALCVLNVCGHPYDDPSRAYERYKDSLAFDAPSEDYDNIFEDVPNRDEVDREDSRSGVPLQQRNEDQDATFDDSCLELTNALRALHKNTNPLKWDNDLARKATQWAEHLIRINQMKHSHVEDEGENLYYSWSQTAASCRDAIDAWYDEIKNYDFRGGRSSNGKVIGHFTQLVWRSTKLMGVGIATKKDRNGYITTYIVAKFSPPGNYFGEYTENVMSWKPGAKRPEKPKAPCDVDLKDGCAWLTESPKSPYGPCNNKDWKSFFQKNCRKTCKKYFC